MSMTQSFAANDCQHPGIFRVFANGSPSESYVVGTAHTDASLDANVEKLVGAAEELWVEAIAASDHVGPDAEETKLRRSIYQAFTVENESEPAQLYQELDAMSLLDIYFLVNQSIYQIQPTPGMEELASKVVALKGGQIKGLESATERTALISTFGATNWQGVFQATTNLARNDARLVKLRQAERTILKNALAGDLDAMARTSQEIDTVAPEFISFRKHFIFDRDTLLGTHIAENVRVGRKQVFMVGALHLASGQLQDQPAFTTRHLELRRVCSSNGA